MAKPRALVIGNTGIAGRNLCDLLLADEEWEVFGVARNPGERAGVTSMAVDLQDEAAVVRALQPVRPTHVFFTAWLRQPTEAENIRVNAAMVRHVLNGVAASGSVEHVALVTGLKHYLGPFEAYGRGALPPTPFREEQPRLDVENFYYAQEDEVFAAAARDGFRWSVHRPHTIVGYALGNAMNMGVTLAVYASLCLERGQPMCFPGSSVQWNSLTDMTDAGVLAKHLLWASTTPAAANQAFNIVNGDVFRWSWMWKRLAAWFGVPAAALHGEGTPLAEQLADAAPAWDDLVRKHQLRPNRLDDLVSPWHTDADLGRPLEVVTDMSRSRKLGFTVYQPTDESFFDLFARLRADRIIP